MIPLLLEFLPLTLSSLTLKQDSSCHLSTGLPEALGNGQVSICREDENIAHL